MNIPKMEECVQTEPFCDEVYCDPKSALGSNGISLPLKGFRPDASPDRRFLVNPGVKHQRTRGAK